MKIRGGSIPEELTYVFSHEKEVIIKFDDVEDEEGDVVVKEKVKPTFVSDSTNPGTLVTARRWAGANCKEITRKNTPMSKLKLIGLDYRGNGGRAWKVMDENQHYFDLREDVLLDLSRTVGISPGGYLNGEYLWGKTSSEMKLIRIGSELHNALLKSLERKSLPKIGAKEFLPGHFYQAKNGDVSAYFGKIKLLQPKPHGFSLHKEQSTEYTTWANQNGRGLYDHNNLYGHARKFGAPQPPQPKPPVPINLPLEENLVSVWINNVPWNDGKVTKNDVNALAWVTSPSNLSYSWSMGKHPANIVKDLGTFDVSKALQELRAKTWEVAIGAEAGKSSYYKLNVNCDPILKERARLLEVIQYISYGTAHLENETIDYEPWIILTMSREPKQS